MRSCPLRTGRSHLGKKTQGVAGGSLGQDGGGDSVKLVSAYSIVMVCKGGGREGDFVPQGALSGQGCAEATVISGGLGLQWLGVELGWDSLGGPG